MISNINEPQHYRITKVGPDEIKREKLHVVDFTLSVTKFLDEHFRGAIRISTEGMPFGYVNVSPDGLAYFIKLLLIELLGEKLLYTTITCTQREIRIDVDARGKTLELDYALHIAEKSGFTLTELGEGRYTMTAPVMPERRPTVYANSTLRFYSRLHYVFLL